MAPKHFARISLRFFAHERPLHEAILRYAQAEGKELDEAIKNLCIQGLRVPHLVGSPPVRHNPLDALLDPILPKAYNEQKKAERIEAVQILEEAERLRAQEPAATEPLTDELPLLGFTEVDELLRDHFSEERRQTREAAKAGAFDDLLSEIEDDVAQPIPQQEVPHVAEGVPFPRGDAVHDAAPPPEATSGAPLSEREPFGVAPSDRPTVPLQVVEPESGTPVVITPQRAIRESELDAVDRSLHAYAATEKRPAAPAPQSDLLTSLVQATRLRR